MNRHFFKESIEKANKHLFKKLLNVISHCRNANQSHNEITLIPARMAIINKTNENRKITSVGWDMETLGLLYCARRNVTWCSQCEDCPGGTADKNPPAIAGDMGSVPGPGRFHMLRRC